MLGTYWEVGGGARIYLKPQEWVEELVFRSRSAGLD